jgi:hypothetical protein
MKGKFASTLVLLVGVLGLCTVTKAEARDAIKLTVPFEFIVDGQTLPAGTYSLGWMADDKLGGLILRNETARTSVFVHPEEVADASSDKPEVSFERVGELYFLSKITTSQNVYDVPVNHSTILEAAARSHQSKSTSASFVGK